MLPSYVDVLAEAKVGKGQITNVEYTLKRTQAFLDSVRIAQKTAKRRQKNVFRIAVGAITTVCGGVAAYYEIQARESMDKEDAAYSAYKSAGTGSAFRSLYQAYTDQRAITGDLVGNRNIIAGIAGAGVVVVGISFAF
jgi:hypothetical protein